MPGVRFLFFSGSCTLFLSMNIVVLLGTVRKGRQSEKPYRVIVDLLKKKGVEPVALDCAELDLPRFDDASYEHPGVMKLNAAMKDAQAVIIVTPEYNHSIPGVLKEAIDYCRHHECMNKPLVIVSASNGPFGGVRAVKQLQHVWLGNKGIALPFFLPTPMVEQFDEANPPAEWMGKAEKFVEMSLEAFKRFV
jgi:NAD(P)H-dependent FMN reductase